MSIRYIRARDCAAVDPQALPALSELSATLHGRSENEAKATDCTSTRRQFLDIHDRLVLPGSTMACPKYHKLYCASGTHLLEQPSCSIRQIWVAEARRPTDCRSGLDVWFCTLNRHGYPRFVRRLLNSAVGRTGNDQEGGIHEQRRNGFRC